MGVARDDLLLMVRALKRGFSDLRAIRKALDRQVSKPVGFVEALHLPAAEADALRGDSSLPDPFQDRPLLEGLRDMLLEGEHVTPGDWEKFAATLARPSQRHALPGLPVPREFDGYTLLWELARRERGVVYRARDAEGREVALKVFRKDVPGSDTLRPVEGHGYVVAPFEEGETLENRKLSARRGAQIIEKAARALGDKAHGRLTPARILFRKDDSVAVLGFPDAGAVPPSPNTQAYAGPSDTHALGAILYEILVGSPPAGETSPATRTKQVDPELDRAVSCALSGGYATPADFADDLARYLRGEPVTGRKAAGAAASKGATRRWAAVAAAAGLVGAILTFALRSGTPDPPPPVAGAPPPFQEVAAEKPAPPPAVKPVPPKPAVPPDKPSSAVSYPPLTEEEEKRLYKECMEAVIDRKPGRVIALANEALARGSKQDWPAFQLAVAYVDQAELDKALEYVSRALQAAPQNAMYLELRAETYALRGEARKALADFKACYGAKTKRINEEIRRLSDARDGRSKLLRGVFFTLKRNYDLAAQDFTAAIELGQPRALAWRARCAFEADDRAAAAADAKAYLAEFPADFAAEEVKALLREMGQH